MKIALIADSHGGIRNDNMAFHDNAEKFFKHFWSYVEDEKIEHVIHLGDVFDRRKYVNVLTAKRVEDYFAKPAKELGINMHIILGNHDVYFRNSNDVNSVQAILGKYDFEIYDKPVVKKFDKLNILMLPWISQGNEKESFNAIEKSNASAVMGHLELYGFKMDSNTISSHGLNPKIFDKYHIVCSGHYHHKSTVGNINYLGSTCEFTWADWNDPKGFHVFDTETLELQHIENKHNIFEKLVYEDDPDQDIEFLKDKYIKLIVNKKTDDEKFDKFVQSIEKLGVHDLQILDHEPDLTFLEDDHVDEAEDTMTILKRTIRNDDLKEYEEPLEKLMTELYQEALSIE